MKSMRCSNPFAGFTAYYTANQWEKIFSENGVGHFLLNWLYKKTLIIYQQEPIPDLNKKSIFLQIFALFQ